MDEELEEAHAALDTLKVPRGDSDDAEVRIFTLAQRISLFWPFAKQDFFEEARAELARSSKIHAPRFASLHEGYAVLLEEVDELWQEVKAKRDARRDERVREECVQIAAMAGKIVASMKPKP